MTEPQRSQEEKKHGTSNDEESWREQAATPMVVTAERKQKLLLAARADRRAWIKSVPLPYQVTSNKHSLLNMTHAGQKLSSAMDILVSLYGDEDESNERVADMVKAVSKDDRKRGVASGDQVLDQELEHSTIVDRSILLAYKGTLVELEKPTSVHLVQGMRRFIRSLDPREDNEVMASSLRSFVDSSVESLQPKNAKEDQKASIRRSLESFIFGHAKDAVFRTLQAEGDQDDACFERLDSLGFISPAHLDIACLGENNQIEVKLADPIATTRSVELLHSPFEKLQRILQVYRGVNSALSTALNEGGGTEKLPSADDVLPTLILTLIKAKPKRIVSNLRMIEVFGSSQDLRGEAGYAFTNLYGALQFLLDLKLEEPGNLTISPDDFRKGLEEYKEKVAIKMKAQESARGAAKALQYEKRDAPIPVFMPVTEIWAARSRGEQVDLDWARRWQEEHSGASITAGESSAQDVLDVIPEGFSRTYSFVNTRPEDVRVADLPQLLAEYRMLVRTTESLLSEKSIRAAIGRKQKFAEEQRALEISALEAELDLTRKKNIPIITESDADASESTD